VVLFNPKKIHLVNEKLIIRVNFTFHYIASINIFGPAYIFALIRIMLAQTF